MSKLMSRGQASKLLALVIAALPYSAFAQSRGVSLIEAAPPESSYDYAVHVQNTYDYRYNPEVREDRILLAKKILRPLCSRNQIVGENKIATEIFGLTTGRPDYVVYAKCLF